MATVNERLEDLMAHLPYATKSGGIVQFRERLRLALLETARDQRHSCADALASVPLVEKTVVQGCVFKDEAYQAVFNAPDQPTDQQVKD